MKVLHSSNDAWYGQSTHKDWLHQQCTYIEHTFSQISKKSIDYIPFHKAIALKGKGAEDDELKEELEELEQSVKENFSSMNQRFDVLRVSIAAMIQFRTHHIIEFQTSLDHP